MKIKKLIKKELKSCREKYPNVSKKLSIVFFNSPSISTVAYYSKLRNEIGFNLSYIKDTKKKYLIEITRHEFGHAVNRKLNGSGVMVHGKEWRKIMFILGSIKPRATIDFSEKSESFKVFYKVKCKCSTHKFSKNKITRLRTGTKYKCEKCNSKIKEKL